MGLLWFFQAVPQYGVLKRCMIGLLLWDIESASVSGINFGIFQKPYFKISISISPTYIISIYLLCAFTIKSFIY